MHSVEHKAFLKTVNELRVLVPPVWAVSVRRVKMPNQGDCELVPTSSFE